MLPEARSKSLSVRRWSVRTYLVVIVVFAVLAATGAVIYSYLWSVDQAQSAAIARMSYRAERAADAISSAVAAGSGQVEGLAGQPGLSAVFENPAGCTLQSAGAGPFTSVRLDIVSRDGSVVCSSGSSARVKAPGVHAGSRWLTEVLRSHHTETFWEGTDAVGMRPAVVVAAPIISDNRVAGAVVALLHLRPVAGELTEDIGPAEHASAIIVDRRTDRVLSTSVRPAGDHLAARFPSSAKQGVWAGVDGTARLFSSGDIPRSGWRVYAGAQRAAVLADARGALTRQLLVGFAALLVLAAAVWILSRRVAGPLRAITDAVVRAGREPDGVRVGEAGTAELAALAREFNAMLDVRAGHQAQLEHQATHDSLTGLPNRTLLRDRLDHALVRDRHRTDVAVLFLGLNRFKVVNDSLGHDAGDRVLVEVAERLSAALRPGDTLARFGGDEFVVLCENVPSGGASRVADRLQRCLEDPFPGPTADITLHAAIGIAAAEGSAAGAERLLREAASAMAQAKATGRAWTVFDDALQTRATARLQTEHALQRALDRDELLVHYQPVLDVATGRVVGAEALVRWQHPERGMVPPMDFIPIAEETGQIIAIGRHVLTRACEQAAAWAAGGTPLRVSVNVAVTQLRHGDFPDLVRRTLATTGLAPEQLCLEITESALIREADHGAPELTRLRDLGVQLSIDDFGTGYSSLSYLHRLPVDELKIDRSFISRLGHDTRESHLVEAIIGMARALGLVVVAEGVETGEQLELLADLGCQLAQGYLIARPQPPEQILTQLSSHPARTVVV